MARKVALGARDQRVLDGLITRAWGELGPEATAKAVEARVQSDDPPLWERWRDATPAEDARRRFVQNRRPTRILLPEEATKIPAANDPSEASWFAVEPPDPILPRLWLIGQGQSAEMEPWPEKYRLKRLRNALDGMAPAWPAGPGSAALFVYLVKGGALYGFRLTIDGTDAVCRNSFDISDSPTRVINTFGRISVEWAPTDRPDPDSARAGPMASQPAALPFEVGYDLPDPEEGTKREHLSGRLRWDPMRGWTRIEVDGWGATDIY